MATKNKTHLERKKAIVKSDKRSKRRNKPTSYDTTKKETSTPQKVRESLESTSEQRRSIGN